MTRTRSEYRLQLDDVAPPSGTSLPVGTVRTIRAVDEADRAACATLLLDAYRGTIDDEGESADDAVAAIDHYFSTIVRPHSFVVVGQERLDAMAFVVVVNGCHYIDPVCTAASAKGGGLGLTAVSRCLASLVAAGVAEVGATITDGNTPSERLFARLGFVRVGGW